MKRSAGAPFLIKRLLWNAHNKIKLSQTSFTGKFCLYKEICMKATGIVRRIDELGRVVIPKEIRSTLRLKSGDPLEIFTDRDELMLKKYSPIASLEKFSEGTAKSLSDLSGHIAVICDTDGVLHASGRGQREFDGKNLSHNMEKILRDRKSYIANVAGRRRCAHLRRSAERSYRAGNRSHSLQRGLSWRGCACFLRKGSKNRACRMQACTAVREYSCWAV